MRRYIYKFTHTHQNPPVYALVMKSFSRLSQTSKHLSVQKCFSTGRHDMAKLDINTKYKMLSGYEIPLLGYGVCIDSRFYIAS